MTGRAVASEAARYCDTLSDLAAAVGAQSDSSADDFAEITSRLGRDRLPGVSGVIFAVNAQDDHSRAPLPEGFVAAAGVPAPSGPGTPAASAGG